MEQQIPRTVMQFVDRCRKLSNSDAVYELFEDIIDDDLRGDILRYADRDSPEPVRASLNKLGRMNNVAVLRNY
jgi:hypothetical protein